jgi:hypothetical protein
MARYVSILSLFSLRYGMGGTTSDSLKGSASSFVYLREESWTYTNSFWIELMPTPMAEIALPARWQSGSPVSKSGCALWAKGLTAYQESCRR